MIKYNKAFHTFASRLRLVMHARNISSDNLGATANVDPFRISAFLDHLATPSDNECARLAEALGVTYDWLACVDNTTPIHVALYRGRKKAPREEWEPVKQYADFILKKYEEKN